MGTPEFDKKVEMRFAHLKTHHGAHIEDITSFAHRIGLAGVFAAAALLAIVAAYLLWRSRRSPVR